MGKIEKKKAKLMERINLLETELTDALTKKTSTTKEINVGEQQRKIETLRKELAGLK
jgi:hypothetical protein